MIFTIMMMNLSSSHSASAFTALGKGGFGPQWCQVRRVGVKLEILIVDKICKTEGSTLERGQKQLKEYKYKTLESNNPQACILDFHKEMYIFLYSHPILIKNLVKVKSLCLQKWDLISFPYGTC